MVQVTHEWLCAGTDVVHVLDFGGGGPAARPTLFIHGVGGSAWTWEPVAEHLDGALRMIAVDLPGYGESRWRDDFSYSSRSLAESLATVAGQLVADGTAGEPAPDGIDVVGFSWGGLVGLAMTGLVRHVRRVVVVDIPASTGLSDTDIPRLQTIFPDLHSVVAASRALAPRAAEPVLWRDAAHAVRPAAGGVFVKKIDPRLVQRWPFRNDDLWPELTAFAGPILLVRAEHSQTLAPDVAEHMVAAAHDAELRTIPDCGHLVPLERPAELAAAIRDYLLS